MPASERVAIEHELALIAELRYEPYFLTVHDVVAYARSQGILCQGRGSAANSRVCYCLGVTSVDPQRGTALLFERFISRERNEPPDIDIDFEHERREEVMQYVYRKYGRERAALAATVIMYRPRSALRDLGKVFGLTPARAAASRRSCSGGTAAPHIAPRVREAGFDPTAPGSSACCRWPGELVAFPGFPRHLSQHVGGFVIAQDLLEELVPIENAAMPERTVVQWDKDDLNDLGLLKVDLLALGMLTALQRAFALVNEYRGTHYTLGELPAEDPRGLRHDLPRRHHRGVPDRVARADGDAAASEAALLLRPGHRGRDRAPGPDPGRHGAPVSAAPLRRGSGGVSGRRGARGAESHPRRTDLPGAGDADRDRRRRLYARGGGCAAPRDGGLEADRGPRSFRERLLQGMRAKGYPEEFAQRIYQQMLGFGEYGFPQSHAMSFALLVYDSAWLKCHEPAAFTCALLNSQPMGFYAPAQLVRDARAHGVEVRAGGRVRQ